LPERFKGRELLPERDVFKGDSVVSGADQADGSQEENDRCQHGRSFRGSTPFNRSADPLDCGEGQSN
jgi:hypothetical protein